MKIRGIAFDLEGTVIDVEKAHHNGHLAAAAEFGLIISLEEAYTKLPHFIGGPREKICEDIYQLLESKIQKQTTIKKIADRDKFYYEKFLAEIPIQLRPGFLNFFCQAKDIKLKLAIGSLTEKDQAMILLERSGLLSFFDKRNIILREHVKNAKPAPDVFLKTAEIMRIEPNEQLVFEDSPNGVKAAISAGSQAIGIPVVINGSTVGALVDAGACRIFFDWGEINFHVLIQNLQYEYKKEQK